MDQAGRRTTRWWLAVGVIAIALVTTTAACGDDDDDSSSDTTSDEAADQGDDGGSGDGDATLEVTEFEFSDVTAPAGGTVEVVNTSGGAHTFTADDGEFDEELGDGQTTTVDVPDEAGDYPYHCEIHPSMAATLTAS